MRINFHSMAIFLTLKNFFLYSVGMQAAATPLLLTDADPAPVDLLQADSAAPVLLVCEHAGRAVPQALGDLGLAPGVLDSHRGWDIGAEAVARAVAADLGAPLILQRYSRLVIDANRPPHSAEAMPEVSDGAAVPGNRGLSSAARASRIAEIFDPMDRQIVRLLDSSPRRAAFSIHSYTPNLSGQLRPWHAGFLSRRSRATAEALRDHIADRRPDLVLAINEPYRIEDATDWFIPVHAEARGLPHCLIEIRNDQIDSAPGAALWAGLLAGAITHVMESLT
ncbi:N-formylglutamate amidohydrolase [Ruegeria pomeroyi]|nr:N-formylglutamate amidohydrolase [Ruegeria pomeroyi]